MTLFDAVLVRVRALLGAMQSVVKLLTKYEFVFAVSVIGWTIVSIVVAVISGRWGDWAVAIAVALVVMILMPPVLTDALLTREKLKRAGDAMVRTNAAKPTGAPRVCEVACKHGDPHRFVYGPTGWEAAGPAVDHRPVAEGVPTS